jgi:prevent-host-death family protein
MAMARAGVAELKSGLSAYLRRVQAGEEVIVTDHGRPVARLVPYVDVAPNRNGSGPTPERIAWLVATGVLRPPIHPISQDLIERLRRVQPAADSGGSFLESLLDERESGW